MSFDFTLKPVFTEPSQLLQASSEDINSLWKVITKAKDSIPQGRRLENLSWRLWFSSANVRKTAAVTIRESSSNNIDNVTNSANDLEMPSLEHQQQHHPYETNRNSAVSILNEIEHSQSSYNSCPSRALTPTPLSQQKAPHHHHNESLLDPNRITLGNTAGWFTFPHQSATSPSSPTKSLSFSTERSCSSMEKPKGKQQNNLLTEEQKLIWPKRKKKCSSSTSSASSVEKTDFKRKYQQQQQQQQKMQQQQQNEYQSENDQNLSFVYPVIADALEEEVTRNGNIQYFSEAEDVEGCSQQLQSTSIDSPSSPEPNSDSSPNASERQDSTCCIQGEEEVNEEDDFSQYLFRQQPEPILLSINDGETEDKQSQSKRTHCHRKSLLSIMIEKAEARQAKNSSPLASGTIPNHPHSDSDACAEDEYHMSSPDDTVTSQLMLSSEGSAYLSFTEDAEGTLALNQRPHSATSNEEHHRRQPPSPKRMRQRQTSSTSSTTNLPEFQAPIYIW